MTSKRKYFVRTEKEKIVFQFTLMLIASAVCGICFSKLLHDTALQNASSRIIQHFCTPYTEENMLSVFKHYYLLFCVPDIVCIVAVFVFSFSFVNYTVTDIVLTFLGFRYGFNSALIAIAALPQIGIFNSTMYWLLHAVILSAILVYSCKMAFYSLTLRKFSNNGRLIVERKALLSSLVFAFTIVGLTLIVGGIYCLLVIL